MHEGFPSWLRLSISLSLPAFRGADAVFISLLDVRSALLFSCFLFCRSVPGLSVSSLSLVRLPYDRGWIPRRSVGVLLSYVGYAWCGIHARYP